MSGHHDQHHVSETKPVAFTVPLILAIVTIVIICLFLSLCDPAQHGHGAAGAHEHSGAKHEQKDEGHRHATDKENVQQHGEATGPEATPARERTGGAHQD
jgi:hypothetical protein